MQLVSISKILLDNEVHLGTLPSTCFATNLERTAEWTLIPTVWKWIIFNGDYTGWQFLSGVIEASVDYTSICIYGIYFHNANEVWFDGFQVNKEPYNINMLRK
ncbi:MAG: hypothetical protein ACOX21_09170 [Bacillota bacterium]|jgi:hypothetical protein